MANPNHPRFSGALLLAAFFVFALAVRGQTLGNPVVGYDEQFYQLVGDRMLHGALPYVDIFDRKPIGLFLIYAGIRLLGGEGVLQYQLVAALAVAATATLIAVLVSKSSPAGGGGSRSETAGAPARLGRIFSGVIAGAFYILWLNFMECEGGQAPVFYNLPMAGAALLTLAALNQPARRLRLGAAAMALVGIAIQIKYTVAIEGLLFGLALLWTERGANWARRLGGALLWSALALLPTALAIGWYWRLGALDAFVFANFRSIFGRLPDPWTAEALGALEILGILSPLVMLAWSARKEGSNKALPPSGKRAGRGDFAARESGAPLSTGAKQQAAKPAYLSPEGEREQPLSARQFIYLWLAAAVLAVVAMGAFLNPQYAAPLLPPLLVAGAGAFAGRRGWRLALALGVPAILAGQAVLALSAQAKGGRDAAYAMARAAQPAHGCLYVYDGYPALYLLTHSCLPSRWVFPGHLDTADEASAAAIGVDPLAEEARILKTRPPVIVDDFPAYALGNPATHALLAAALAKDYRLSFRMRTGRSRYRLVYRLKTDGS